MAAEDHIDFYDVPDEMGDSPHWGQPSSRRYRPDVPREPVRPKNGVVAFASKQTASQDEPYEVSPGYLCTRIMCKWTDMEEQKLLREYANHKPISDLAQRMGRTKTGVLARLEKLGIDVEKDRTAELARIGYTSLQHTTQGRMMSDFQHLIALCQTGYTTVEVRFLDDNGNAQSGQTYTYKVPTNLALEKGDILVVPARQSFKLVKVDKIHAEPQIDVTKPLALKWAVQKVDFTGYNDQTQRETDAIAKLQVAERKAAQQQALEVLMGSVGDREEFLRLLNGTSPA